MAREVPADSPADADVEILALSHAPPVTLEITAEQQLGRLAIAVRVRDIESKLRLFRNHRRQRVRRALQVAGDRTEVPARTDDDRRLDRVVTGSDNPPVAVPSQRGHRRPLEDAHTGPAKQEVIELAPPDGVADDVRVSRFDEPVAPLVAVLRQERRCGTR